MKHFTFISLIVFGLVLVSCNQTTKEDVQKSTSKANKENSEPMKLDKFQRIELLTPDKTGEVSLMEAMHKRHSDREFDTVNNLSLRHLSNILWVANGINRDDAKRTVPSAMAMYPIKTYAVLSNGIYFYDPNQNVLEPVIEGDYRELTGLQDFVYTAPLNVLFIADYNVYDNAKRPVSEERRLYLASLDAAHSCQNIYLYCAAENLRTVERAGAKAEELLKVLNLDEKHQFIVAQTVGY